MRYLFSRKITHPFINTNIPGKTLKSFSPPHSCLPVNEQDCVSSDQSETADPSVLPQAAVSH